MLQFSKRLEVRGLQVFILKANIDSDKDVSWLRRDNGILFVSLKDAETASINADSVRREADHFRRLTSIFLQNYYM